MKNKNNKSSGFFTSLLGVMLGISLTFGVNALWQKYEEKKKTREILILVRNELETNKQWFKNQEKILEKDIDAFNKILKADNKWTTIPEDSLKVYINRLFQLTFTQMTTSAWQIFQNSEMIQKISNKELVIRLTDCYFVINFSYDFVMNNYWDKKMKEMPYEAILEIDGIDKVYDLLDALMSNKETVNFLRRSITYKVFHENLFPTVDAVIDYTISLLDKYGNFRYDMDEKDKELESFIKARKDSTFNSKTDSSLNSKKDSLHCNP